MDMTLINLIRRAKVNRSSQQMVDNELRRILVHEGEGTTNYIKLEEDLIRHLQHREAIMDALRKYDIDFLDTLRPGNCSMPSLECDERLHELIGNRHNLCTRADVKDDEDCKGEPLCKRMTPSEVSKVEELGTRAKYFTDRLEKILSDGLKPKVKPIIKVGIKPTLKDDTNTNKRDRRSRVASMQEDGYTEKDLEESERFDNLVAGLAITLASSKFEEFSPSDPINITENFEKMCVAYNAKLPSMKVGIPAEEFCAMMFYDLIAPALAAGNIEFDYIESLGSDAVVRQIIKGKNLGIPDFPFSLIYSHLLTTGTISPTAAKLIINEMKQPLNPGGSKEFALCYSVHHKDEAKDKRYCILRDGYTFACNDPVADNETFRAFVHSVTADVIRNSVIPKATDLKAQDTVIYNAIRSLGINIINCPPKDIRGEGEFWGPDDHDDA